MGTAAAQPQAPLSGDSLHLPPARTQLAFVREGQIYLINADGSGLVQLTDTEPGVANMDPAWSRDGQRLAFARGSVAGGPWDIYIMDADGSNVIQLTGGGYNIEPTWGPDDRAIAFTGGMGLSVIDLDADGGQESTNLLDRPGWNAQPAWSPDGQTITFSSDYRAYDIIFDLYAMNVDGSEIRPLLQGPFFASDGPIEYYQSAWSPDGQWIAFSSSQCRDCQSSLRYVQVDGSIEDLLMDDGHSPAWRPDPDIQNAPYDPEGPIKEPDEPKDPDEPNKPAPIKLPECGPKCDKEGKLTREDSAGHQ